MATSSPTTETQLPTQTQPEMQSQQSPAPDLAPPPPKSKTEPYYSVLPQWSDVTPIPQADIDPSNPPLAAITYTPRYTEAMSYLRAVMAANEFSERCLALTEDLISMNPAHYTVWIYRMRILKRLWGIDESDNKSTDDDYDDKLRTHIQGEVDWLNGISATNLKNYQIYQHRHNLADLLPVSAPPSIPDLAWFRSEQTFLRQILSLDSKNYHVWSYRSWLCRRFADPLLRPDSELSEAGEMDRLIAQDVYNNSAWTHRYFVLFGHREIALSEALHTSLKSVVEAGRGFKGLDEAGRATVQREMEYAQAKIRLAPQNASPWNYLRGVLRHGGIEVRELQSFVEEFVGVDGDVWTGAEGTGEGVRSSHAVEWLSETYARDEQSRERARDCLKALAEKWDPIRRNYWEYRLKQIEDEPVQKTDS